MLNFECPHCHQRTISAWRKQWLGPGSRATCSSCGGKSGVPWSTMNAVLPVIGAIALGNVILIIDAIWLGNVISSYWAFGVPLAAGFVAMFWLHHKFVPLIAK